MSEEQEEVAKLKIELLQEKQKNALLEEECDSLASVCIVQILFTVPRNILSYYLF